MRKDFVGFVVCPKCYHKFRAEVLIESQGHVYEGSLNCLNCQIKFEISKGIPRLMFLQQNGNRQVRSSFGYKWAKEPDIGTGGLVPSEIFAQSYGG